MSYKKDLDRCAKVARRFYVEDFRCKILGSRRFLFLGKILKINKDLVAEGTEYKLILVFITPDDVVMFKPIESPKPMETWLLADAIIH